MTLAEMKAYLRVDDSTDDSLIQNLMASADSYLADAVDDFSAKYEANGTNWQRKADLAKMLLVTDWYEQRLPVGRPVAPAVELIITQLQL
jgi:uncharacterized phage protein (predicted DNA packaging)